MKKRTIVIVGSDESAGFAAKRAKEISHDVRLVLIEKSSDEQLALDLESNVLVVKEKGSSKRIRFDSLIYCGGFSIKKLFVEGLGVNDIQSTLEHVSIQENAETIVLGCGRDGIAIAQKLKSQGARVSIFDKSARVLPKFSFEFAQTALKELGSLGISVFTHEDVKSGDRLNNGVLQITTTLGRKLHTDFLISAVGTIPNTTLLEQAGAMMANDQTVFVDEHMSTTLPHIYACGDAVSLVKAISLQRDYRSSLSMKERSAQVAATNAVSTAAEPRDRMQPCAGSQIIQLGKRFIGRTGLTHVEARQFASNPGILRATVTSENTMIRLLASRESGNIVGGEIYGDSHLTGQLDLISMAVVNNLKASDLVNLDVTSVLREAAEQICSELRDEVDSITGENIALWLAEGRAFQWLDVDDSPSSIGSQFSRSTHVPLKDLERDFRKLQLNAPVVLSCRSGRNAMQAYRILKKQRSAEKIFYLEGGTRSLELLLRHETTSPEIV